MVLSAARLMFCGENGYKIRTFFKTLVSKNAADEHVDGCTKPLGNDKFV